MLSWFWAKEKKEIKKKQESREIFFIRNEFLSNKNRD